MELAGRRRGTRAALALATLVMLPDRAHADRACSIPPGQEALAQEILGAGESLPASCRFDGASLERDRVRARYRCGSVLVVLVLQHPRCAPREATSAGRFAITAGPSVPAPLLAEIAERARQRGHRWRWIEPSAGVPLEMHDPRVRVLTLALFALSLASAAFLARRRARIRHLAFGARHHAGALAVLALFVLAALVLPQHGPVHNHLTYIARSDCAYIGDCAGARPGWSQPAYDVYGVLLSLFPYRLTTLWALSLGLTTCALALFYAFAYGLASRLHGRRTARRIALVALGLAALNPLVVRLSVGTSFWPWALTALFGSGVLSVIAARSRGIDRAIALAGGGAALALALSSTPLFFVLAPLALVAPLAIARRRTIAALGAALIPLALVGFYVYEQARSAPGSIGSGLEAVSRFTLGNVVYFDRTLTPIPLGVFFALGLVAIALRPVKLGALLYAVLAIELTLSPINLGLDGYPSRFLHGFVSLFVSALVAAIGVDLVRRLVMRRSARAARWVTVAAIAAIMVAAPFATEGWRFLLEPRPLAAEAAQISAALDRLPRHDVLVIAPDIMEAVRAPSEGHGIDPIEVHYLRAEHRDVMRRRFGRAPRIVTIPELLEGDVRGAEILVYVGSSLVSWQPAEIAARVVPPDLARPELARLRAERELVPVYTFELDTRDHPAVRTRIGAGRSHVELGFYRVVPRQD